MAGNLIITCLKSKDYKHIVKDIEDYLAPVLKTKPSQKDGIHTYGMQAVKLLHTGVASMSSDTVCDQFLQAMLLCYTGYSKTRVQLSEPLTVLKLMYNLLTKTPVKGFTNQLIEIGKCLFEEISLEDRKNPTVLTIIQATYKYFWNIALKIEQAKVLDWLQDAFVLRQSALSILALGNDGLSSVIQKYVEVINRFDKTKTTGKVTKQTLCLPVRQTLEFLEVLQQSSTLDPQQEKDIENVLSLFVTLLSYGVRNQSNVDLCPCLEHLKVLASQFSSQFGDILFIIQSFFQLVIKLLSLNVNNSGEPTDILVVLSSIKSKAQNVLSSCSKQQRNFIREGFSCVMLCIDKLCLVKYKNLLCDAVSLGTSLLSILLQNVNKSKTQQVTEKAVVHLLRNIMTLAHKLTDQHKGEEATYDKLLDDVLQICALYERVLESPTVQWSEAECVSERYYCSYYMSKFAHECSSMGRYKAAVNLYTVTCSQMTKWVLSDVEKMQHNIDKVCLLRLYENLSDCQLKCGQYREALDTILSYLSVDRGCVMAVAKAWVKVRKEILNNDIQNIGNRILGLEAHNVIEGLGDETVHELMSEELRLFEAFKKRKPALELEILIGLLSLKTLTTRQKAVSMLNIVQLYWQYVELINETTGSLEQYLDECCELLEHHKPKGETACLQGRAYLWKFVIIHEHQCQQVLLLGPENSETNSNDENEAGSSTEPPQNKPMYTFVMENINIEWVDKALACWEMMDPAAVTMCEETKKLISSMLSCIHMMRILQKKPMENRALGVLQKLLNNNQDLMPEVFAKNQDDLNVLREIRERNSSICSINVQPGEVEGTDKDVYVQNMLIDAKTSLLLGRVQEGVAKLYELISNTKDFQHCSVSVYMAEGTAKRLLSTYVTLCDDKEEGEWQDEYSLDLAVQATRMHTKVLQFLLGKDFTNVMSSSGRTIEKWTAVSELLMSYLNLGYLYRIVGEARESKCYLKEGLKLAYNYCLPSWNAQFLHEICILHSLSDNLPETTSCLQHLYHLYEGQQLEPSYDKNTTTSTATAAGDADKLMDIQVPPCLDHVLSNKSISCNSCSDPYQRLRALQTGLVISHFFVYSGRLDKAENMLTEVVEACQKFLTSRQKFSCKNKAKVDDVPSDAYNIYFQETFLESACLKADIHLFKGESITCLNFVETTLKFSGQLDQKSFKTDLAISKLQLCCVQCSCEMLYKSPEKTFTTSEELMESPVQPLIQVNLPTPQSPDLFDDSPNEAQEGEGGVTSLVDKMANISLDSVKFNEDDKPKTSTPEENMEVDTESKEVDSNDICKDEEASDANVAKVRAQSRTGRGKGRTAPKTKTKLEDPEQNPAKVNPTLCHLMQDVTNKAKVPSKKKLFTENVPSDIDEDVNKISTPVRKLSFKSVSSAKAALELLLEDSDEDLPPVRGRGRRGARGGTSSRRGRGRGRGGKSATKILDEEAGSELSVGEPKSSVDQKAKSPILNMNTVNGLQSNNEKNEAVTRKQKSQIPIMKSKRVSKTAIKTAVDSNENITLNECKSSLKMSVITVASSEDVSSSKSKEDIYDFDEEDTETVKGKKGSKIPSQVKAATRKNKKKPSKENAVTSAVRSTRGRTTRQTAKETARACALETDHDRIQINVIEEYEEIVCVRECVTITDEQDLESSIRKEIDLPSPCTMGEVLTTDDIAANDISNEDNQDLYFDLDVSIELLRGDNKKKGREAKEKTTKSQQSKTCTASRLNRKSSSGESTEVLRSGMGGSCKSLQLAADLSLLSINELEDSTPRILNGKTLRMLQQTMDQMKRFPTCGLYSTACNLLALHHLAAASSSSSSPSSPLQCVFYLSEAMANTFRHHLLININKKIRLLEKKKGQIGQQPDLKKQADADKDEGFLVESNIMEHLASEVSLLQNMRRSLEFNKSPDFIQHIMESVPTGYTVCQVSVATHPKYPPQMIISRLEPSSEPVIMRLPGFNSLHGGSLLPEFSQIMEGSSSSMKISSKTEWWQARCQLDDRMHALLDGMERNWLSAWKVLLLGNPWHNKDEKDSWVKLQQEIAREMRQKTGITVNEAKLQILLQGYESLTEHQCAQALSDLVSLPLTSPKVGQLCTILHTLTSFSDLTAVQDRKRQHVVLILDKMVQHLPWENLPCLRQHSVSRVQSLLHLHVHLSRVHDDAHSVVMQGVNSSNTFYILNPDNNLQSTQETFAEWFTQQPDWDGIVGIKPTQEQFKEALTKKDLLLYLGHGTGSKYFHGYDLSLVRCRAAAILMGCSSGQLRVDGQMEAAGMMLNYFMAGCPCMLANLWDVTDKDIDRFLAHLLSSWLEGKKPSLLSDHLPGARDACKLPYLIGAAPVVYGLPVFIRK